VTQDHDERVPDTVAATGQVYQLRVVLAGISPLIWRRLLVADTTPLADLHAVLQTTCTASPSTGSSTRCPATGPDGTTMPAR
jgi:hypothetical protein